MSNRASNHAGAQHRDVAWARWKAFLRKQGKRLEQQCLAQFEKAAECGRLAPDDLALVKRTRRVRSMPP